MKERKKESPGVLSVVLLKLFKRDGLPRLVNNIIWIAISFVVILFVFFLRVFQDLFTWFQDIDRKHRKK